MVESDVNLADRTCGSLVACAGIISSWFMLSEGISIGHGLLDVSAALGPLLMPPDVCNPKCLLTQQCSCPSLGVLVLVQALLPVSGSGALDHGRPGPEEAVDCENLEEEVIVVVTMVYIDSGHLTLRHSLSGEPLHPRFPSSWKDLVVSPESLHWEHSRGGRQVHRAFPRQQND